MGATRGALHTTCTDSGRREGDTSVDRDEQVSEGEGGKGTSGMHRVGKRLEPNDGQVDEATE